MRRTVSAWILLLLVTLTATAVESRREFYSINAANNLADNSAEVIVCTKTGRMIISTIGNLNFYDGTGFTHIDVKATQRMQLPEYRGGYRLMFDRFHHLWVKNKHTVTIVDLLYEKFLEDPEAEVRELGCNGNLQDVFTDSIGNIWFLTDKGLTDVSNGRQYQTLRDRNLQELTLFDDMLITFYDNGEEIGLNIETGEIVHRTKAYDWEEAQKYNLETKTLLYDNGFFVIKKGEKESALFYFNVRSREWQQLLKVPYMLNDMAVHADGLYLASSYGYWVINLVTGEQRHMDRLVLATGQVFEPKCSAIEFDKQGGMWLGTERRGVLYARPRPSPIHTYENDHPKAREYAAMMAHMEQTITEFNGMQINCMYVDSRGWSWFGTSSGLYLYREPQSPPLIFNRTNGLLNNVIHAVVEDKNHNIWLSTSNGVSCVLFDENNEIVFVNSFNEIDKVPIETFLNGKALLLPDGHIVMQSVDHVLTFHPDSFALSNSLKSMKMYPKLIRLMVNGNVVVPGEELDGNIVIHKAITREKDITVNSDQNSLELTFSGLNYFRPLQTYYRVRIPGLDDEWKTYSYFDGSRLVDSRGMLHLPLMGLEPGEYTIQVQASMFPNDWENTEPYEWVLHVNQEWWQATAAYMGIIVVILLLVVVNIVFFSRNTRMRARRNADEDDIIRKINGFVERSDAFSTEILAPMEEELNYTKTDLSKRLNQEFITMMVNLVPVIREQKGKITMMMLSDLTGMDIIPLYDLMTNNLYKSPKELALYFRLQRVAKLLATTDKKVEEISVECGFYTPNYLMGTFFHHYKMTPKEYREENKG